jgi:hypothetical protein
VRESESAARENALVAAAYEAAARILPDVGGVGSGSHADEVRALTPASAKSALDSMLAKAREEGRQEQADYDPSCPSLSAAIAAARAEGAAEERDTCARLAKDVSAERLAESTRAGNSRQIVAVNAADDIAARIRARGARKEQP